MNKSTEFCSNLCLYVTISFAKERNTHLYENFADAVDNVLLSGVKTEALFEGVQGE